LSFAIDGPNKTGKKFDVITLFHVLEHIKNPVKTLADLRTYLKADGTLIVEIPNADDFLLQINKNYKDFFWQRASLP